MGTYSNCEELNTDHEYIITFVIGCFKSGKNPEKHEYVLFAIQCCVYSSCVESTPEHEYRTNCAVRNLSSELRSYYALRLADTPGRLRRQAYPSSACVLTHPTVTCTLQSTFLGYGHRVSPSSKLACETCISVPQQTCS